jgi:hypothetical protein
MELTLTLSSFMLCTYVEGILASNTIALGHILKKKNVSISYSHILRRHMRPSFVITLVMLRKVKATVLQFKSLKPLKPYSNPSLLVNSPISTNRTKSEKRAVNMYLVSMHLTPQLKRNTIIVTIDYGA